MQAYPAMVLPSVQGGLNHFAGFDAFGADTNAFDAAINDGTDALQIGQPPPLGEVVGMAYVVSITRFLAANFTNSCHCLSPVNPLASKSQHKL